VNVVFRFDTLYLNDVKGTLNLRIQGLNNPIRLLKLEIVKKKK